MWGCVRPCLQLQVKGPWAHPSPPLALKVAPWLFTPVPSSLLLACCSLLQAPDSRIPSRISSTSQSKDGDGRSSLDPEAPMPGCICPAAPGGPFEAASTRIPATPLRAIPSPCLAQVSRGQGRRFFSFSASASKESRRHNGGDTLWHISHFPASCSWTLLATRTANRRLAMSPWSQNVQAKPELPVTLTGPCKPPQTFRAPRAPKLCRP